MVKLNTGPKIAECFQFVQMELDRFDAIYAMLVITENESHGVYRVDPGGLQVLLPNTAGIIYPSWYPDCHSIAVDDTGAQVPAQIDATTGQVIRSPLGSETVSAGFPSIDQTNPNHVAIAGQFNACSPYYNQDLNYVWVADTSTGRPRVAPLDRHAPRGPRSSKDSGARPVVVARRPVVCVSIEPGLQRHQRSDLRHLHSSRHRAYTGDASQRLRFMECSASEMVPAKQ
jgi:hypothetical protein